ncbi:MAG: TolC family protein, partial [Verrucomicrobiales bacterium]|nr:TolC family protein [Verrucomicrobiales bacterium]
MKWLLTLPLLAAAGTADAQTQPTPPEPVPSAKQETTLTLKQCVILALQQAYNLQIQAVDGFVAEQQLNVSRSDYDPVFTASINYNDTTDPGGRDACTGIIFSSETQTYSVTTNISGLVPSGGRYTLGANASDTEGLQANRPFSNSSLRGPSLEFRQPLLKNFAIDDTRLNIRVSLQNLQISSLDLKQAMLETVSRVEEAYFDLIAAKENVKVQESA